MGPRKEAETPNLRTSLHTRCGAHSRGEKSKTNLHAWEVVSRDLRRIQGPGFVVVGFLGWSVCCRVFSAAGPCLSCPTMVG